MFLLDNSPTSQESFDYLRLDHLYSLRLLKDILACFSGNGLYSCFQSLIVCTLVLSGISSIPPISTLFSVSKIVPQCSKATCEILCFFSETFHSWLKEKSNLIFISTQYSEMKSNEHPLCMISSLYF